jgi:hypothetical protein
MQLFTLVEIVDQLNVVESYSEYSLRLRWERPSSMAIVDDVVLYEHLKTMTTMDLVYKYL